ncbi:MAG: glycerol-3-phosphate 1-O-acyltransferase PlsY [Mariprofundales bacterium]|nr:glycerol-3-phosphate 1-O-acyltransferase PlsY [Mariprofundales bacterium]
MGAGYLSGSIPFGLLFSRWLAGIDPRQTGSGNIGATNAMRAGGRKVGLFTLLADIAKGALPVAATLPFGQPIITATIGLSAVLGHLFPIWLKFHGGKGVATMLGVLLAWQPLAALAAGVTWLIIYRVSHYVSLASILASLVPPILLLANGHHLLEVSVSATLSLLLIARHHANISRLLTGEEPKTQ